MTNSLDTLAADYADAYEALHGERPQVIRHGMRHRFRVATRSGACDMTAGDLRNATRALRHLTGKGQGR